MLSKGSKYFSDQYLRIPNPESNEEEKEEKEEKKMLCPPHKEEEEEEGLSIAEKQQACTSPKLPPSRRRRRRHLLREAKVVAVVDRDLKNDSVSHASYSIDGRWPNALIRSLK